MSGKFLKLSYLCCILAFSTQPSALGLDRAKQYHGIAQGNYLIGDNNGALLVLDECLRFHPDYLPALQLKSRILLDQDNVAEALEVIKTAVAAHPKDIETRLIQAVALGRSGDSAEALRIIESAIRDAPPDSRESRIALKLYGIMKMAKGDWDEAAAIFQKLPDRNDVTGRELAGEAYLEKANQLAQKSAWNESLAAIDQAIALYHEATGSEALEARDRLHLLRAKTLARIGKTNTAISELRQLVARSPENLEAITTLASLYAATEQWASLDGLIAPIAAQAALADIALYLEGRAALARDRVGTARIKFEQALKLQNKNPTGLLPTLLFYEGLCLQRLNRIEDAERRFEDALAKHFQPETIDEATTLGRMLLRTGRAGEAIPILEKTLLSAGNPKNAHQAWTLLARAQDSFGQPALAISALNKSLQIQPDQPIARALRGSLLRKIGDLEGALADYEAASILDPGNSALLYALALTHLQLGQLPTAEQKLGLANTLTPDNPGQQLLHALLAHATGTKATSRRSLENYLRLVPENANPSAHYLSHIIASATSDLNDPIIDYLEGKVTRKDVLDWAGRAETPEIARAQICAAAYWLAQQEKKQGNDQAAEELLQIALESGSPENPEWQFARWQLAHTPTP